LVVYIVLQVVLSFLAMLRRELAFTAAVSLPPTPSPQGLRERVDDRRVARHRSVGQSHAVSTSEHDTLAHEISGNSSGFMHLARDPSTDRRAGRALEQL